MVSIGLTAPSLYTSSPRMGTRITAPQPTNSDHATAISVLEIRLAATIHGLYSFNGTIHHRLSTDINQVKRLL